jgi:phosphoribosyl 1,2-cyclic phosphate phosphodiesterase
MNQPFRRIDAILVTHSHYDHVGGMDDIRPFCQFGEMNVYADPLARQGLLQMLPYCFAANRYPGVPAIGLHEIHPHEPFRIGDFEIVPFQVMHHDLPILGFRIGALAYITDMKSINDAELPYVEGAEVLVVNALRVGRPHHSHQLLDDAIAFSRRVGAQRTYLVHASHEIGLHASLEKTLPQGVHMAYDGQVIEI